MIDAVYFFVFSLVLFFLRPVCRPPRVLSRMLSHEECDHIMATAEGALTPSTVAQSKELDERTRKSETAWLDKNDDKIVRRITHRLLKHCDRPTDNCESLQVVRYKPGGFYKPHHDAFKEKNPRMYTFLIALNDDYEGGATAFPRLKKEYRLKKGDVLLFDTLGFRTSPRCRTGPSRSSLRFYTCRARVGGVEGPTLACTRRSRVRPSTGIPWGA
jgi:prolyl 4-hydroxylase